MIRAAVIFESSPFDRKGLFNAVHNRVRHLAETGRCEIDAFCVHSRDTAFTRRVRHTPAVPDVEQVVVDGFTYRILWYDFSIADHLLVNELHRRPFFFSRFMERNIGLLQGYDFILAHSFTGGLFALEASRRYGVPYCVTWHGSDIHTHPWRNPMILRDTREVMEAASCNFFVSRALLEDSDRITPSAKKMVIYNGVSEAFVRFPDDVRLGLRKDYGLTENEKVVAFAGSVVAVKNVYALQPIFHSVRAEYDGKLKFWIIGDGKLRDRVEKAMVSDRDIDVRFWGNVAPDVMPSMLNCVDVLVLPSVNEGLGMVCAEAIRCGAVAVGSDVGGIPEVVGRGFVVPPGEGFVDGMAALVADVLRNGAVQSIPDNFDWKSAAETEISTVESLLQ